MSRKKVEDNEDLVVKPLGAGQEVRRSCVLLEFIGKKVMINLLNVLKAKIKRIKSFDVCWEFINPDFYLCISLSF